jgi:hypothetical protein
MRIMLSLPSSKSHSRTEPGYRDGGKGRLTGEKDPFGAAPLTLELAAAAA